MILVFATASGIQPWAVLNCQEPGPPFSTAASAQAGVVSRVVCQHVSEGKHNCELSVLAAKHKLQAAVCSLTLLLTQTLPASI